VNRRAGSDADLTFVRKLLKVDLKDVQVVNQGHFLIARPRAYADLDQLQLAFVDRRGRIFEGQGISVGHFGHDPAGDLLPRERPYQTVTFHLIKNNLDQDRMQKNIKC
jgi:hypothetical protein